MTAERARLDTTSPAAALAEPYLETLTAPAKHLEWFERSGHNPCYEEPAQFNTFVAGTVLAEAGAHAGQRS